MGGISGKLKRALWPLVEARARELETQRPRRRRKVVGVCLILFAIAILLSSAGIASAELVNENFEFTIEGELHREIPPTPTPAPEPTPAPTSGGGGGGGEFNPDFSVSISPSSQTITRGESASYSVTVRSIERFSGLVELSLSGTPSSSSYSMLSSVYVQCNGVSVLGLTISTTSSTPKGSYTLTVTGTNGGRTRSASAALVITENNPTLPPTDTTPADDTPAPPAQPNIITPPADIYAGISRTVSSGMILPKPFVDSGTCGAKQIAEGRAYDFNYDPRSPINSGFGSLAPAISTPSTNILSSSQPKINISPTSTSSSILALVNNSSSSSTSRQSPSPDLLAIARLIVSALRLFR